MTINWGLWVIAAMVVYSRWPLDIWYEWGYIAFMLAASVFLPILEQRVVKGIKEDMEKERAKSDPH